MISVARKARPRRSPNRVALVEPDGSPVSRPARDWALSWPPSADDWFWEPGEGPHDLAAHVTLPGIEPEAETAAEFMARLASEEAMERDRVLATYQPLAEDLEEYAAWSQALDAGTLTGDQARRFSFGSFAGSPEYDAIRRGQVSEDELAQLAAHGCI